MMYIMRRIGLLVVAVVHCFINVYAEPSVEQHEDAYFAAEAVQWKNVTTLPQKYNEFTEPYLLEPEKGLTQMQKEYMKYALIDLNADGREELLMHDTNMQNVLCTPAGCQLNIYQLINGKMKPIFSDIVANVRLSKDRTAGYRDLLTIGRYPYYLKWNPSLRQYTNVYDINPLDFMGY